MQFNVTAHPTSEWTAQQLREAFPFEQLPRHLLRDRDGILGSGFREDVKAMGIQEVFERLIGTVRRECLDHVIVFNEASLYRHVRSFVTYYHLSSTHLSLDRDTPETRPCRLLMPAE